MAIMSYPPSPVQFVKGNILVASRKSIVCSAKIVLFLLLNPMVFESLD